MKKRGKKAQTDVIVTVLLVLVALVAVALISTFIIRMVRENVADAEIKSKSYDLSVERVQLVDSLNYRVYVKRTGVEEPLKGVTIVLEDSSGTRKSYKTYTNISILEMKSVDVPAEIKNVVKVEVYPLLDSSGREFMGNMAGSKTLASSTSSSGGTGSVQVVSSNLIAYYPFEGNANDASGNGNNGVINGAVLNNSGKIGQAYSFNGSNIRNITVSHIAFDNRSFSIGFWFYLNSLGPSLGQAILEEGNVQAPDMLLHLFERNSRLLFGFYSNDLSGLTDLVPKKWYNAVFVYNNATKNRTIYLDGRIDNSQINRDFGGKTGNLNIGMAFGGNAFNGTIDELRIYNKALSPEEVTRLYNFDSI